MKKWIIIGVTIAAVVALVGVAAYMLLRQTWSAPDVVQSMEPVPNVDGVVRAQWSPDGNRILYEASGIWITNTDGTNQVCLADGRSPVWNPDGSLVAFVSDDGIELISPDATGRRLLVSPTALAPEPAEGGSIDLGAPAWSPDGGKIAFELGSYVPGPFDPSDPMRQTGTSLSSIWIINSDGSDPKRLTTDSAYEQRPSWSRDGQSVTFLSNRNDGEYGRMAAANRSRPRGGV
jgi:Tol biopolymer transport system component